MKTHLITYLLGLSLFFSVAQGEENKQFVPLPPAETEKKQSNTPDNCIKNDKRKQCKVPKKKHYQSVCQLRGRYRTCF